MIMFVILCAVGLIDVFVLVKLSYAFRILEVTSTEDDQKELPSVSICISARDETHAMTQCLEQVVASDYPKMEVIVLDDGSRDDTSLLIKSFAHAGVRFVEGKPLPDGWLGKNYAQSILADEASGKFVFFMDVDTLVERYTLTRVIDYALKHDSKMVSIIPIRNDHWAVSTLFTTMRHFWVLLRFRPDSPRAVANAWLMNRQVLVDQFQNDTTLPQSMQVETTIAKKLSAEKQYRLILSNTWLGLRYEKRWTSQIETSIRLLYPQCGKHLYEVIGLIILLAFSLAPYVALIWDIWALGVIVAHFAIAHYYLSHVWARYRLIGALLLPLTIIQEICLLFISYYRYRFGTITWKGRPITTTK